MVNGKYIKNQEIIDFSNLNNLEAYYLKIIESGPKSEKVNEIVAKVRLLDDINNYERNNSQLTDVEKNKIAEWLIREFNIDNSTVQSKRLDTVAKAVMKKLEGNIKDLDIGEGKEENDLALLLDVCFLRLSSYAHKEGQSYKNLPRYTIDALQKILNIGSKADVKNSELKSEFIEFEMEKHSQQLVELYNLIFGPAQALKESIDNLGQSKKENMENKKIDDAVVAVYGAIYDKMIDRIDGLEALSEKVDLINGVIFSGSGGRFWRIDPDRIKRDSIKSIIEILNPKNRLMLKHDVINKLTGKDQEQKMDIDIESIICERVKQRINAGDNGNLYNIIDKVATELDEKLKKLGKDKSAVIDEDIRKLIDNRTKRAIKDIIENAEQPRNMVKKAIKEIPDIKKWVMEKNSEEWMQILEKGGIEKSEIVEEINKYKALGEAHKSVFENENWNVNPIFLGMLINNIKNKDDDVLYQRCKNFVMEKNNETDNNVIEKESKALMQNVKNDNANGINNSEFYSWEINRFIENNVLHSMTEADVMLIEWKKKDASKVLAELMSRKWEKVEENNLDIISDEKHKIIMDKKATNSAENAINTIEEVKKLRKENPENSINSLIVVSDWRFLIRQYLTTKKKAEEAHIDNLEIMGYPGQKVGREESKIKYKSRVEFAKFALGELGKIIEYDDVGDAEISSDITSLEERRPKVFIGKKEFGEVIDADLDKAKQDISERDITSFIEYEKDINEGVSIGK